MKKVHFGTVFPCFPNGICKQRIESETPPIEFFSVSFSLCHMFVCVAAQHKPRSLGPVTHPVSLELPQFGAEHFRHVLLRDSGRVLAELGIIADRGEVTFRLDRTTLQF